MSFAAATGTKKMAIRKDATTANSTATASGVNRYLASPDRKITGKNTTMNVTVDTNSGTITS